VVASNNFKQQLKDLLEKEGLKCSIEETDNGLLVVERKGRWRAKPVGLYYFVADNGTIRRTNEDGGTTDQYRYETHNYFKTEQDAEQHHQNQRKLAQLKDYILQLRDQGFRVEFQATDIEVAELIGKKFGAVSLF
jgi:hypothetical protein